MSLYTLVRRAAGKRSIPVLLLARAGPLARGGDGAGVELVMDKLYVALSRMAVDPTDFYHLPRDRVVELGERVSL